MVNLPRPELEGSGIAADFYAPGLDMKTKTSLCICSFITFFAIDHCFGGEKWVCNFKQNKGDYVMYELRDSGVCLVNSSFSGRKGFTKGVWKRNGSTIHLSYSFPLISKSGRRLTVYRSSPLFKSGPHLIVGDAKLVSIDNITKKVVKRRFDKSSGKLIFDKIG